MRVLFRVGSALLISSLNCAWNVESLRGEEVTLSNTEAHSFSSEVVGQEFRLSIARPFGPPVGASKTYPVIYVLDAEVGFPMVRQVVLSLRSGGELPPVLIVGIGYAGGFGEGMVKRNRDYTPTADPVFTKFLGGQGGEGSGSTGGAEKFLAFIRTELKPFVEARYPADPSDSTLFGVSFGGLFATYALLHYPSTFQRYVIGSPSLWWGNRVVFEYEKKYAESNKDLAARVFIAAGGHETSEHDDASLEKLPGEMRQRFLGFAEARGSKPLMVEAIDAFVEVLGRRSYPSLDLTWYVFPQETHGSAPPMIISRGLRVVFGTL